MSGLWGAARGGEAQERPTMAGGGRERAGRCHYPQSHLSLFLTLLVGVEAVVTHCGHPQCCQGQVQLLSECETF